MCVGLGVRWGMGGSGCAIPSRDWMAECCRSDHHNCDRSQCHSHPTSPSPARCVHFHPPPKNYQSGDIDDRLCTPVGKEENIGAWSLTSPILENLWGAGLSN